MKGSRSKKSIFTNAQGKGYNCMHTISLSLSPLISTASRTVNVLVTTELCLEPSRDVATALIVTYHNQDTTYP